jgi:hypothetical protein
MSPRLFRHWLIDWLMIGSLNPASDGMALTKNQQLAPQGCFAGPRSLHHHWLILGSFNHTVRGWRP